VKVGDLVRDTRDGEVSVVIRKWGEFFTLLRGTECHWTCLEIVNESR